MRFGDCPRTGLQLGMLMIWKRSSATTMKESNWSSFSISVFMSRCLPSCASPKPLAMQSSTNRSHTSFTVTKTIPAASHSRTFFWPTSHTLVLSDCRINFPSIVPFTQSGQWHLFSDIDSYLHFGRVTAIESEHVQSQIITCKLLKIQGIRWRRGESEYFAC